MSKAQHLNIYEMNYSVSPGGVDEWVIQTEDGNDIASFLKLTDAVEFAYQTDTNFTVHTLAAWEQEYGNE